MKMLLSLVLCLIIIGVGVGVVYAVQALYPKAPLPDNGPETRSAVNVHVKTVRLEPMDDLLLLTGRIEAWEQRVISAEVAGTVDWQGIEEGDLVSAGQEIFKLDTAWYVAAHSQARAQSELAGQELDRAQGLKRSGVSSPQELDRAVTQKKLAAADVQAASTQLEKASVRAPISGVIDKLYLKGNEWADRGQPLVRIIQTDRVKAIAGLPERDAPRFSVGDPVAVTLDALSGMRFEGKIFRIATSANPLTRTFNAEIELDNANGTLKPGMTVRAQFIRQTFAETIVVPIFSVLSLENQRFVLVEDQGTARMRPIETGILQGDRVQVAKGLQAGDRLIVVGQRDVHDGEKVQVVKEVSE